MFCYNACDVIVVDLNLMMLVISEGLKINDLFHNKPEIFKFHTHG